jgi:hypothetical protein
MPLATDIAATAAKIRNQLPKNFLPKDHLLKASLPIFCYLSHARRPPAPPSGASHGKRQGMLTIPPITSSFGAPINGRRRSRA